MDTPLTVSERQVSVVSSHKLLERQVPGSCHISNAHVNKGRREEETVMIVRSLEKGMKLYFLELEVERSETRLSGTVRLSATSCCPNSTTATIA